MKKLNKKNLLKMIILIGCSMLIIHDLVLIAFAGAGFTAFGLGTFCIAVLIADSIVDDFEILTQRKKSLTKISTNNIPQ